MPDSNTRGVSARSKSRHKTPHNAALISQSASLAPSSPQVLLLRFRQRLEIRNLLRTIKIPLPHLLRQHACRHTPLPAPLRRTFCHPCPIEPSPADLETRHLRLRVHHQPLLVNVAITRRVGICGRAGTGAGIGWTGGREDRGGRVGCVEGARPAGADVDVVEVGRAVSVCLGPFAAEGGTEAGHG